MIWTVLAVWICLAVPAAVVVAALGRSGLLEDQALGHLPTPGKTRTGVADRPRPAVAASEVGSSS
jgi:hypothetical protein